MKLLSILTAASLYGGQAITLSNQSVTNSSVPALSTSQPCTIELMAQATSAPPIPSWDVNACPVNLQWNSGGPGDYHIQAYWLRGTGGSVCLSPNVATQILGAVYFRFGVNPSNLTTNCEVWDIAGNKIISSQQLYTGQSGSNSNGVALTSSGGNVTYGFFRVKNVLVPFNSAMPYTSDTSNMMVHWKLDGSLTDTSGNGFAGSLSSGSASYSSQLGQSLVVASTRTCDAKVWGNWVSQRIGTTGQLCGDQSLTQADSGTLAYSWVQTAGSPVLTLNNSALANPTMSGFTFGGYTMRLTVVDTAMNSGSTDLSFGAVPMDDNGVVQHSNANVAKLFGPQIAFGKNPWGYEDERNLYIVAAQQAYFNGLGLNPPSWATSGTGTVSYPFAGKGPAPGQAGTTLSGNILASTLTIPIAQASVLSLNSLPTWIYIGNGLTGRELIRICGTSATSGAANLTVCYDGRGMSGAEIDGTPVTVAAQAWSSGTTVGEMRIQGSGTAFITDSIRPVAPGGAPGPPGPVTYSTGNVSLAPSSATVTGIGSTWNTSNGVQAGYFVRVTATHGGGTPFVWWSRIGTVTDVTHLIVDRALPPDVDSGPFPYSIISYSYFSLEFTVGGIIHRAFQATAGCESETVCFANLSHDIPSVDTTTFSGMHYSTFLSRGSFCFTFCPNFYGSGLALRRFYYRSGLTAALTAANTMDEYWVRGPEVCDGLCGGSPLAIGGGVIGAIADLVLNSSTVLTWDNVRQFASVGSIGALGCNSDDTRDTGYEQSWLTLAAIFDTTQQSSWITALQSVLTRDQSCKRSDNSFANGFYWSNAISTVSLTNGSAAVTGSGLTSQLCDGLALVTVSLVNGSASFTVTSGTISTLATAVTANGRSYSITRTDAMHGSLSVLWPGSTGSFSAMIRNTDLAGLATAILAFGTSQSDADLQYSHSCIFNTSSSITLDRVWAGSTGSKNPYAQNLAGFGQQPFMLGIKLNGMRWAAYVPDSTVQAGYAALTPLSAAWVRNTGYNPGTQGMSYGRIFQFCESGGTDAGTFNWKVPGCQQGLDPASIRAARVLTAETSSALRAYFESGAADAVTWGDTVYGSVWGYCPWTDPGFYCDANYVRDENSNASLNAYKWPGFFFGMGASDQWAAVRSNIINAGSMSGNIFLGGNARR